MSFNPTPAKARKMLMDLVAQRDHSEKELRKKLSQRCDPELVESTLAWAKEQNWLPAPEKLQTEFADQLGRRGKGINKINQKLRELGLSSVNSDPEAEFIKARKLALAKWSADDFDGLDFSAKQKLQAKIMRFLIGRGFETAVVSKILKTEFKRSGDLYDEEF